MERIVEQALLYDFYGELLTAHQKEIYGDYVQNDLSPSEIAQDHGITRQAAYDMIKRCNKILEGYEEKLHLLQKFLRTKGMVMTINRHAKDILEKERDQEVIERLKEIENISNAIIEEY
ncbi:MAG: DNA-binding protein [Lachnospiraceae bacterium]|nr:DNA-binding protein [Lachnospiraceae bacterium]